MRRKTSTIALAGLAVAFAISGAALLSACNSELPAPAIGAYTDAQLDSLTPLQRDSFGIWRDPDLGNRPFADMPLAYREFWRYCFSCHSSSGQKAEAREARRALRIDTWREVVRYGPGKLILAVKAGGMPLRSAPKVPPEVLDRVQAYLATWNDSTAKPKLFDFQYAAADSFVRVYCSDCHTAAGKNPQQPRATQKLILDNYATWHRQQGSIAAWIDTTLPGMPPEDYRPQPTLAERRRMLQWIDSLSPNTKNGLGHGALVAPIGALRGSKYDTATALVRTYCADCHTEGGFNGRQWDGWAAVQFDTYAQWKAFSAAAMSLRLQPDSANNAGLSPMPPGDYQHQPSDAERAVLLEWLKRGSPNTVNGLHSL